MVECLPSKALSPNPIQKRVREGGKERRKEGRKECHRESRANLKELPS
jgi:hypothetical protein